MSKLTEMTRNKSYKELKETLGDRQKSVLKHLVENFSDGATAKELSVSMFESRLVPSPERNSVHPRLNELVEMGIIYILGTKTCDYSNRKVAIYKSK